MTYDEAQMNDEELIKKVMKDFENALAIDIKENEDGSITFEAIKKEDKKQDDKDSKGII